MSRQLLTLGLVLAMAGLAGAATLTVTTDVRDMGYNDGENQWYYVDVYFSTDTAMGVRGAQIDGVTPMAAAPAVGAGAFAEWGTKVLNGGYSTISPIVKDAEGDGDDDIVGCSYYIASATTTTDATIGVGGSDLIVSMYFKAPLGNTPVEVRANVLDPRYFDSVTLGPPPQQLEIPGGNAQFDEIVVTGDCIYTVPEPATIGLVLMGIVGLIRRK